MQEICAIIKQLGLPTWFTTFSAAETRWNEVIETLLLLHNDKRSVNDIEWSERCSLINNNPVMCARMFDHHVVALFRDVIMSPAAPLGIVVDYCYRAEFQQRGSPNIHCLLWIKDAPKFNENSDEKVCHFIDKYISCSVPDQNILSYMTLSHQFKYTIRSILSPAKNTPSLADSTLNDLQSKTLSLLGLNLKKASIRQNLQLLKNLMHFPRMLHEILRMFLKTFGLLSLLLKIQTTIFQKS